jgi:hypothetical protein
VQVGSINASPSTAVNAPVNANAPVSVASETGDSSAQQDSGGAQASSTSSGGSNAGSQRSCECDTDGGQSSATQPPSEGTAVASPPQAQSDATAQAGDTDAHPASSCCDDKTSSSCECNNNSNDNFVWGDAGQRAIGSLLTIQLGKVVLAPASAVNAPVNVYAPVSVLSKHGSSTAEQESGGAQASTAPECGEAARSQSVVRSIGTVQVGSVDVAPATAVNAPINVNAPVAVLSGGGRDESAARKSGGATALARPLV